MRASVVSGCNTSPILEFSEQAFNFVALFVKRLAVSMNGIRRQREAAFEDANANEGTAEPATALGGGVVDKLVATSATQPPYTGSGFSKVAPRYPYRSRRQGREGRVVIRVQVSANGDVAGATVWQSSGYRLLN